MSNYAYPYQSVADQAISPNKDVVAFLLNTFCYMAERLGVRAKVSTGNKVLFDKGNITINPITGIIVADYPGLKIFGDARTPVEEFLNPLFESVETNDEVSGTSN